MKQLLAVVLVTVVLCSSASAEGQDAAERERLLAELSVRLQSQLVELPGGIHVRGSGIYEVYGGKGVASPYVNTAQKGPGEVFLNLESYDSGVFMESAQSTSYEGLFGENPPGTGSMVEMTSSDFYKPRTSTGMWRLGYKQLNKPTEPARYTLSEMDRPAGYGTVGVGPIAAQRTLADFGLFDVIVNRVEKHLEVYRIEAASDTSYTTFTMTWTIPVDDGYYQEVTFVFDDSLNGCLVNHDVKLSNPTTNHTRLLTKGRAYYAPAPAKLVEAGIPWIMKRSHYVEKASPGPGKELDHVRTYDFRFSGIEAIAGEPAPPEWYTKWQKAWDESEAYKATLAAKEN